jgi:hypothetical protein
MSNDHLLLDPAIRDWVIIPMLIMVVLVGLGRQYGQTLMKSNPAIGENELIELRCKQTLMYCDRLRSNGKHISEKSFELRRSILTRKPDGLLREKVPGAANPMSNPSSMIDMMKGNVIFMVPNFAMMGFVGYFFSGFICLKIPFPMLSTHFKLMMQRGVDLSTLDVSYVSSLSWYFMLTFGLNGVYKLLLGDGDFDDMNMMQMQVSTSVGDFTYDMRFYIRNIIYDILFLSLLVLLLISHLWRYTF